MLELESPSHEARREGDSDSDADTRRVAVAIRVKGGGGGLALGESRGLDAGTTCLDVYRAVKARADLAVSTLTLTLTLTLGPTHARTASSRMTSFASSNKSRRSYYEQSSIRSRST